MPIELVPPEWQAVVALCLVGLLLFAFMSERFPPEVTAAGAAAVFILLGLTPTDEVMGVFSNSAPITIAALFILSGALVRTGLLEALAGFLVDRAGRRPRTALILFFLAALVASAFVNNTPIVLILIPVIARLARSLDVAETRLLIPLSYVAILGGVCTLIGTSTNILASGVAAEQGLAPFSIFEITGVGVAVAVAGVISLSVLGPMLLPDRRRAQVGGAGEGPTYLTEARLRPGYPGLGTALSDVSDFNRAGLRVVGLRTGERIRRRDISDHVLKAGDALVIRADQAELLTLREQAGIALGLRRGREPRESDETMVAEAIVTPVLGRRHDTLGELDIGGRFNLSVLGVHRHGHQAGPDLAKIHLRPADKLMLEGPAREFERLSQRGELVSISLAAGRAYRRAKAPIAFLALVAVVVFAALGVAPIEILALLAVAGILVLRCIDNDEAWAAVDGGILVLIFAMLIVGRGMESTGAVALLADTFAPMLEDLPPVVMLAAIYALSAVMTETVTNNAVAVVVTPIAIAMAQNAGFDPRGFVVGVMVGASASFATPIGYQTNTLVYGAGNYRFADFLRVGVPMNLIAGLVAVLVIPLFFPLDP